MLLFSKDSNVGLSSPPLSTLQETIVRRGKANMADDSTTDQAYWGKKGGPQPLYQKGKGKKPIANPRIKERIPARTTKVKEKTKPSQWTTAPMHRKPHSLLPTYRQSLTRMIGAKVSGGPLNGTVVPFD